jgi:hypothetical protein
METPPLFVEGELKITYYNLMAITVGTQLINVRYIWNAYG